MNDLKTRMEQAERSLRGASPKEAARGLKRLLKLKEKIFYIKEKDE